RVLERLADEHRAALELVGVARRPVLAVVELRRDVEEEAARRQLAGVEGRRIQDRLPRRSGLSLAVAGDVVLRFELAGGERLLVVAGAAGVGDDVTGAVVPRTGGRIADA